MKNKKIVIAGGTGFIGRSIAKYFADVNEIVILSRQAKRSTNNAFENFELTDELRKNVRLVQWNAKEVDEWAKEIDGCDLVINLAGKSVNCRYNKKNKKEIFDSRTNSTKAVGEAIRKCIYPPKLWINAASATIYRHATDRVQDELTGEMHNDFSVQVCKLWEQTFFKQRTPFTRKGAGGVMIPYFNLVKFGLGGRQGSGNQMYSWVHIEDVCRCVEFMFNHPDIEGVYNVCSPNPVTNNTFMKTLRKLTQCSIGLPAYEWMIQLEQQSSVPNQS
jgi:uncharacterized protein